jgi:thiamine pyrophosphokinase
MLLLITRKLNNSTGIGTLKRMQSTIATQPKSVMHDNSRIFSGTFEPTLNEKAVLLILNNPPALSRSLIARLWHNTHKHVCADGGSNWLYENFGDTLVPTLVHGDLDSIRPEVAKKYKELGSEVIADKRDDATDLDKCLLKIKNMPESSSFTVFIAGVFGSRFDHEMGNLNSAFKNLNRFNRLVLISADTVGEILEGGREHVIVPDRHRQGPICGMIPLFGPSKRVDTSGLRWNMEGRGTEFGALVSTSNEIAEDEIRIKADGHLLWTTTLSHRDGAV